MPGTFTHWLIVHKALESINEDPSKLALALLINDNKHWAYIGAQGPDYPYVGVLDKDEGAHWADWMHEGGTGYLCRVMARHISSLLEGKNPANNDQSALVAWYLGFLSHVLADAFLHPVVAEIVGPYEGHEADHRMCEMVQDTLLYEEIWNKRPAYDGFFKRIKKVEKGDDLPAPILRCWDEAFREVYPAHYNNARPAIARWHEHFLGAVQKRGKALSMLRHAPGGKTIIYPKPDSIPLPDRERYFDAVQLPNSGTGSFRLLFDKAYAEVAVRWWECYLQLAAKGSELELAFLMDWDLDTGRISGIQGGLPTYWV